MEKTYESAMKRLAEIVGTLEHATLDLQESLQLYEEGTKLAEYSNKILDDAEQKITNIGSEKEEQE